MSESPPVADYQSPQPKAPFKLTPAEWFWFTVLAISLLVGFGMTAFAPT